jgi:hypothetical protein
MVTLNLAEVSVQISAMAAGLQERRRGLWHTLELAKEVFAGWSGPHDLAQLRDIARDAGGDRLVAAPVEPLGYRRPSPPAPPDHVIVGTDGSQIDLDRHGLAPCFLINVGSAVITYGRDPAASLTSQAHLYFADADQFVNQNDGRVAVQGSLLDLQRTLAEQQRALSLVRRQQDTGADDPFLVIADGTLILWKFSGREGERAAPIVAAYVDGLRAFQSAGVPVCSYVSRPAARDVMHLLSAAAEVSAPPWLRRADLHDMALLHDRLLFEDLPAGARSALFASQAPALDQDEADQRIHFFYLNVGAEIGRVEVPGWVAHQPDLLDLVHALVARQCHLGWGYPIVLSEAHEQAVIRGGEREAFVRMVSSALNDRGLAASLSLKRLSKNRRAV